MQNENDPAFALISDYVSNPDQSIRIGAVLGLGLAYAGTNREEVEELLLPFIADTDVSMELSGFAALALGLVFTSTCKEDIVMSILQVGLAIAFGSHTLWSAQWKLFAHVTGRRQKCVTQLSVAIPCAPSSGSPLLMPRARTMTCCDPPSLQGQ